MRSRPRLDPRGGRAAGSSAASAARPVRLLTGASLAALAIGLTATPSAAQLAQMRAAAGTLTAPPPGTVATAVPLRPANMREALQRSQALQSRADQLRGYVTSARNAVLGANTPKPSEGISDKGLDPIAPIRNITIFVAAGQDSSKVTPNAPPPSTSAAADATGLNTWQGASAPVQTSKDGKTTVTINQTDERALLSWKRFDIGANTTLTFSQKSGGVAQTSWTVVNRVVDAVAPSRIFGSLTADGTVLVLNSKGVLFGQGAQVNLHSLIASSLDIGNFASTVTSIGQRPYFVAATIKDRNTAYLQNGLLVAAPGTSKGQFLSARLAPGTYDVNADLPKPAVPEGQVLVDAGASITATSGGAIILAGPSVTNAGTLTASDGQVSLQGGRYIGATTSTGATGSADPNVRGLILTTQSRTVPTAPPTSPQNDHDEGIVVNIGYVESRRGYLSLRTGAFGSVTNGGLLAATTSVSRNGKIDLAAGTVTLAGSADPTRASGITILPDSDGETIPQGTAAAPPSFKTSQITIGDAATGYLSADTAGDVPLFASTFVMGRNAFILAPSAQVVIGQAPTNTSSNLVSAVPRSIDIQSGAVIDVGGVKDVQLDASRNSLTISPLKRNELRDTPNYREPATDGRFTLNGATVTIDPRVSGVRADGVTWVGSPLLEAGSAVSQTPVTAAELMTKGGAVSLDLGPATGTANLDPATVPSIRVARNAVIDISGGWVTYAAGTLHTTQLLTSDGRVVDIADADPNDDFVALSNGYLASQPKFGINQSFSSPLSDRGRFQAAYDEGRDAGALIVAGSRIAFDGRLHGDAFAGANQLATARQPGGAATITGDTRRLQLTAQQLPSGGFFRIGSFTGDSTVGLGGDILVFHGTSGAAGSDPTRILLGDQMLSGAGLSALSLQTSGGVTFAGAGADALASSLVLANGGTLEVDAGRSIRFDGGVTIAGGTIRARTYVLSSLSTDSAGTVGSAFRSDDDIAASYAGGSSLPHPFDITVTGLLSTAGRWVNDYLGTSLQGSAWIDGGTVSLTVAPRAFVPLGLDPATAHLAVDLSGRLTVASGALIDVSAGGYVASDRSLTLTARGGHVRLVNETTYAGVNPTIVDTANPGGTVVAGQTVSFTPSQPSDAAAGITPSLVPATPRATVQFDIGSIKGFGFGGGGAFTLVSPDVAFGDGGGALATRLPLDVLQRTGFGTLDVTSYHSRVIRGLFDNGSLAASAFFDTTRLVVRNGQTLNLSQALLPSILDPETANSLVNLQSGASVRTILMPAIPASMWDQQAAMLTLRGLTELDVEAGGRIVGAPEATIVAPKIHNAGTIILPGGTIAQVATLPPVLNATGIGVTDVALGGSGLAAVFGPADAAGRFAEDAANALGLVNASDGSTLANGQIFSTSGSERFLYFLGEVAADEGIVLDTGSVTNVAGTALLNPHAPYRADGTQFRFGRLLAGGSVGTAAALDPVADLSQALFPNPDFGFPAYPDPASGSPTPPPLLAQTAPRTLIAKGGSVIDLSGASAIFDIADSPTTYAPALEWSDAGTLSALAGGNIAGSRIDAHGGAAQATGGTIEWFDPDIRGPGAVVGQNYISAAQIENAGFDTLVAYGGLTLDGDFALKLGKSLLVMSAPSLDGTVIGPNSAVAISATAGTVAQINAPYVHFSNRSGTAGSSAAAPANGIVTFAAGTSGIDFSGGILFDDSVAKTYLVTTGDVRLSGVDDRTDATQLPVLNGQLISTGDLSFDAARVYTTTGTGNLQAILQAEAIGSIPEQETSPYLLAALGRSEIIFRGNHMVNAAPLSAGSYLSVQAYRIVQNGYLAAPLGRLEFGTALEPIRNLRFGTQSVTSVSGAGSNIPYGTTADLTDYFFTPGSTAPITRLPSGDLRISGYNITVDKGGTIDARGGGDVFAYEFVSGTGGSRDVLSRFNTDTFSSNDYDPATGTGLQYADGRQVYAIVPADQTDKIAAYDPVYSADYGASGPVDLYGLQAGLSVTLDGGGGIAAGKYLLLPAHYALLPGAYRVVENSGDTAPSDARTLRDGSVVMGGHYSTAGTGLAGSERLSFTVESQASFLRYSTIRTTSGTATIKAQAAAAGVSVSRIPLDAARVVLNPLLSLKVAGLFDTAAATGGRGAQVDILGKTILIDHDGTVVAGKLVLSDTTLANLNANSLVIGAQRTDNAADTTTLQVSARSIEVAGDATLKVPELVLAVGGQGSTLRLDGGARLVATGTLADGRAGDYLIQSDPDSDPNGPFDATGIGSLFRLANGPRRLVDRQGDLAVRNSKRPSQLRIGAATISGEALTLDTSRSFFVSPNAVFQAPSIAVSADQLQFGGRTGINAALQSQLATAQTLTLRSADAIGFAAGRYTFHDLAIDTPGLALAAATGDQQNVTIDASAVRLSNSGGDGGACGATIACAATRSELTVNATSLSFGSGTVRTYGFDGAVALSASAGTYYTSKGVLDVGAAALSLRTPFLIDRAAVVDPDSASPLASDLVTPAGTYTVPVTPNYRFATSAAVTLSAPAAAGSVAPTPAGLRAPGAHIAFGSVETPVSSLSIAGVAITASAGVIDVQARGDILLSGATSLATPGYTHTYGDNQDSVTVSAGGGTVNLASQTGNIALPASATVSVDNGLGNAGTLNLLASEGGVTLGASLNPLASGSRGASLVLDSQTAAFDLDAFAGRYGSLFGGEITVRAGTGDLALGSGHMLKATGISLIADGGAISVAGTIDTSGITVAGLSAETARTAPVDGGDIALFGRDGVSLLPGARLDTHSSGARDTDTRQASAGDVTIGIGEGGGAIVIASGTTIDMGARRTQAAAAAGESGDRLVAVTVKDPATLVDTTVYKLVEADEGGTLSLRAPVIGAAGDKVDIRLGGTIVGAGETQVEGYRSYDLGAIAASGAYSGVTATPTGISLDLGASRPDASNILSDDFVGGDGTQSIVHFVRNFDISTVDGSSLAGMRLRPGVELRSTGDLSLDSNWNLAAGVLDQRGALAAGLLKLIPELGTRADGTPYYAVASGGEGRLLDDHVSFLYRVGGKAGGEAGVFTLKAAGDMTVAHSISDGFFTFADKSDPAYISYQLGGGDRTYNAAVPLTCGDGQDCSSIVSYADVAAGEATPDSTNTVTIALNRIVRGEEVGSRYASAPYDPAGNSAIAAGSGTDGAGDPLGFGQLFPLLPDGSAIHSSGIRLVAGTGALPSANPLHVDRATHGNLIVSGETSYTVAAVPGSVSLGDTLRIQLRAPVDAAAPLPVFAIGDLLGTDDTTGNVADLTAGAYASVSWGAASTGAAADERRFAQAFFKTRDATFLTSANGTVTGVAAALADMLTFFQRFEPRYLDNIAAGAPGYPAVSFTSPAATSYKTPIAYARTVVRTGDGEIAAVAAGNVDLTGGTSAVYRTEGELTSATSSQSNAQVGGTAIYTAGVRVAPAAVTARIVGTSRRVTVMPDSPYLAIPAGQTDFVPSPKALTDQAAVLATGGGSVTIDAGGDVLGRRDVYAEQFLGSGAIDQSGNLSTFVVAQSGDGSQRWRPGVVGQDTEIAIAPRAFSSGIGALAGGDVTIRSGGDLSDLTVALDAGVTTSGTSAGFVQMTMGGGDLTATIGGDLRAGQFDVASGEGRIVVGGSVAGFGTEPGSTSTDPVQYLRLRVADATVSLTAKEAVTIAGVTALGAASTADGGDEYEAAGFFSPDAGLAIVAGNNVAFAGNRADQTQPFQIGEGNAGGFGGVVLPPSLEVASLTGSFSASARLPLLLYPSAGGQLSLLSAGTIGSLTIAMSDSDPSLLPGAFSAAQISIDSRTAAGLGNVIAGAGLGFGIPGVDATTSDRLLRLYHNQHSTHADDPSPARIYAGIDIDSAVINLPKQARIGAGRDIRNLYFTGQNLAATDTTRISAGRDIVGSFAASSETNLPYVVGSNYVLGGPGGFGLEAGRTVGPFMNSATVANVSYGGGIRTVGNDMNPWLGSQGADLSVLFGIRYGVDYAGLRETYLNPAYADMLDGDLFVQVADGFGNASPDRTRPIYAPILAAWLRDNDPAGFMSIFATTYPDTDAGNAALADAAYAKTGDLYTAFAGLDPLLQDKFLVNQLYFNELKQAAVPSGPSYLQYIRGYRAAEALFPARLGYTDNLAPYTTDPSTVTADHPLGVPTRDLVDGQPKQATRVETGNVDLRLATVETTRGGDITILGPGGDFIAGSVVRTSEQAARRVTRFGVDDTSSIAYGQLFNANVERIDAIPIGLEGILTLRGGAISSFTDGDFRVNQSRVFSQAGGDISLWSSNGDLNAGQGPRSASNFPPVTVRFDIDAVTEVDSAGSVSGAGIGAFKRTPTDPDATVILIAPVGLVDAGDAGVRATGDIFVAAARVANADSFSAGGTISGVPSLTATPAPVVPAAAAAAVAAQRANAAVAAANPDRRSIISVDVLGPVNGDDPCADPARATDATCRPTS